MKKIILGLLAIVFILVFMNFSFAGDVPEALLMMEESQTYIGEITEIRDDSMKVIQKYNFKGEFTKDKEYTYKFVSEKPLNISVGEQIVCGDIGNSDYKAIYTDVYYYKIDSFENGKIKLLDPYDMTKRLEDYINNGDFAKAEQERIKKLNEKAQLEAIEERNKNKADGTTSVWFKNYSVSYIMIGVVVVITLAIAVVLLGKNK